MSALDPSRFFSLHQRCVVPTHADNGFRITNPKLHTCTNPSYSHLMFQSRLQHDAKRLGASKSQTVPKLAPQRLPPRWARDEAQLYLDQLTTVPTATSYRPPKNLYHCHAIDCPIHSQKAHEQGLKGFYQLLATNAFKHQSNSLVLRPQPMGTAVEWTAVLINRCVKQISIELTSYRIEVASTYIGADHGQSFGVARLLSNV